MKIAAYARFSSDNQRQESIDAQMRAIRDYCDKNGHEIVRIYADEAVSATSDQRDQFLRMIADSKNRWFDAVIVHKLDRFARNRYDSAFYKRELRNHGVRIISILEQLDDSPESVILESVLEGMAEYYSMNLAREVRKGMNENALKALHNGGIPPLGLDVNPDKTYSINETEAQTVRKIFELYSNGYGYLMIANELNKLQYKTKIGKPFGRNSIYDILRNEKYIGRYVFNKRASKMSGNRVYKKESGVTRIDGALPQIISNKLWDSVQDKMNLNLKPRMNATRLYLLTGHLECGVCGSNYFGSSYVRGRNGVKNYIYACNSRDNQKQCINKNIRAELIENFVIEMIQNEFLNDNSIYFLSGMVFKIVHDAIGINKEISKELLSKREQLLIQVDKLLDLYLDGLVDKSSIFDKVNRIKSEIENYDVRIKEIMTGDFENIEELNIVNYMKDLRIALNDADRNVKKTVIDALIDKIIVYPDDVKILFKLDPFSQKNKKDANGHGKLASAHVNTGGGEPYLIVPFSISKILLYQGYNSIRGILNQYLFS